MHAPVIVQAVEKHLHKVIFKVLFEFVASWGLGTSKCKLWFDWYNNLFAPRRT
jgi:hypothetical protein